MDFVFMVIGSSLLSGLTSGLSLVLMFRWRRLFPLDIPNNRSLHSSPTPRIGGLGILFGVAMSSIIFFPDNLQALLLPAGCLVMISLVDDYFDLAARWRFLTHLFSAGLFIALLPSIDFLLIPLVFFALGWMTNLYNFMDGADGLAGGMALFGFGVYGFLAWVAGDVGLAAFSVSIAAAATGFLAHNFPPSRLFMGDTGSVPLGFLSAALGVLGWQRGLWSWTLPVLVFSPFIVDASVTLLRRALHKESIWRAHRGHYYQRLVRMGWSHRRLALGEYTLMSGTALSGVMIVLEPDWQISIFAIWILIYLFIMLTIDKQWRYFSHEV